jgi:transcriptional regulator of acetoin/glycerol metabolism
VLERALILSDSGRLAGDDFARILSVGAEGKGVAPQAAGAVVPYAQAEAAFEKRTLEGALAAANGQIAEAARMLRISRATFYKKLAKFGLAASDSSSV